MNQRENLLPHSTYIFDFDGTLVDSMPYWSEKMLNILINNDINYPTDIIKRITPLGDVGTAKFFKNELGVKLSIEEMIKQMDDFALPKYREIITLKPGVLDFLHALKKQNCSLNVLTASPHKMVDVCLERNGVFDLFDNVWTCEDFNMTKSEPQIYIEAVGRVGSKICDTAFFDDNINAVKAAKAAGLFTVGVYDESGKDFSEQMKQNCDLYLDFECCF